MLKISTAPHFYSPVDTRLIMRDVIIALAPAGLAAVALFGMAALIPMVTAVAGCVLFEYVCSKWWLKTTPSTRDLSAVVTGLLLAYNLPCNMPVWTAFSSSSSRAMPAFTESSGSIETTLPSLMPHLIKHVASQQPLLWHVV